MINSMYNYVIAFFVIDTPDFEELKRSVRKSKNSSKNNFRKKKKENYIKSDYNNTANKSTLKFADLHFVLLIKLVDFIDQF